MKLTWQETFTDFAVFRSTAKVLSLIILRKARFPYQHVIAVFQLLTASLNTKKFLTRMRIQ